MTRDNAGQSEWVAARSALARATACLGDQERARRSLRRMAGAGIISTRATETSWLGRMDRGVSLQPCFWSLPTPTISYDQAPPEEEWETGRFQGHGPLGGLLDAFGVEFKGIDLDAHYAEAPLAPSLAAPTGGALALPKWDWETLLIELVAKADKDGLIEEFDLHRRGGQAGLEKWMKDWFARRHPQGETPSESEIRRRASAIKRSLAA